VVFIDSLADVVVLSRIVCLEVFRESRRMSLMVSFFRLRVRLIALLAFNIK
jgi:hypothetical protein